MWLEPVLVTAPAVEPVGRSEAKEYLRIDAANTSLDGQVDIFIAASRSELETLTGIRLITQSVRLDTSKLAHLGALPIAPVQSITSISYYDTSGDTQTLDAADYELIGSGLRQAVAPAQGVTWPMTFGHPSAVRVEAVVGYGDAAANIPEDIRFALLRSIRAKMDDQEFDLADAMTNFRIWQ